MHCFSSFTITILQYIIEEFNGGEKKKTEKKLQQQQQKYEKQNKVIRIKTINHLSFSLL
jgi:hypothetical protein